MLTRLLLLVAPGARDPGALRGVLTPGLARIRREFPAIATQIASRETPTITARDWQAPDFDLAAFDARLTALAAPRPFSLCLAGEPALLAQTALQILTRCQRLSPRRNEASRSAHFDRVLERHRALHDLEKPLVRADHDHALDTWQWMLRIKPDAGLAAQAAALFHDVERLASEADSRVEHHAPDYQVFKDAHAAQGAEIARRSLAEAGLAPAEIERAARLVAHHEQRRGDPDADLLNDADALSFFSLNSGGFMDYYGPSHTRRKIAYSLARLGPEARLRLEEVRLRPDVAALVEAAR